MADNPSPPPPPSLANGVALSELAKHGKLLGRLGEDDVLLVMQGQEVFAVGAACTHYHGPLMDGLAADKTVHCPWHHACFDLRTGEALHAPAFDPIDSWDVEVRDGKVFLGAKRAKPSRAAARKSARAPDEIVIVGGGAAGFAAAEMLRRHGYQNKLVMLSEDDASPVDRPNLSKDYLAGTAPEDWVPLRPDSFFRDRGIDLRLETTVLGLDARKQELSLAGGKTQHYDRLLLATGAEPVKLDIPGADKSHVHVLRSLSDSRAIIAQAKTARRAVVIGASFIGLEVAASLRNRGLDVHVVAPEKRPMERILGAEMGDFVRALHEEHGVAFHLEDTVAAIMDKQARLKSGGLLDADLVVMGVGVRPRTALAAQAGLALDRGVVAGRFLETSAPNIYAAGDIVRWPDPHSGQNIRVEHWVVAERQGQVAALNMLGETTAFAAVPFFWSQHYDVPINYVGHAEAWDKIEIDGDIAGRDCLLRFIAKTKVLAVASIYRDQASLEAELAMAKTR